MRLSNLKPIHKYVAVSLFILFGSVLMARIFFTPAETVPDINSSISNTGGYQASRTDPLAKPITKGRQNPTPVAAEINKEKPRARANADESLPREIDMALHSDWMGRVYAVLGGNLSENVMKKIKDQNILLLSERNALSNDLYTRKIGIEDYQAGIRDLVKSNQDFHKEVLSDAQYEKLFEFAKDETDILIDSILTPLELRVEVLNPAVSYEEVTAAIPADKLNKILAAQKTRDHNMFELQARYENKEISVNEIQKAAEAQFQAYVAELEKILDPDEIQLLFGDSAKN